MKLVVCFFASVILLSACAKNNDSTDQSVDRTLIGNYSGTFNRSGMDTAKVTIIFNDRGRFEGSSSRDKYPAICRGSFTADASTINFGDSCTWTANFDWTLILNGTYNISYKDATNIRIYRSNGAITDEYLLSKTN